MSRVFREKQLQTLRDRVAARGDWFVGERLTASALVFAAHPDDETLGCGGTIARKVAAGAAVQVAVLTDGGSGKAGAARERQMSIRREEMVAAMAALGVIEACIRFFDFEDGRLSRAGGALPDAVGTALLAAQPAQVFVPYRSDGHPDHEAAFHAVRSAVAAAGLECELYEYPVWAWRHWPWVRLRVPGRVELPPWLATAKFLAGRRFTGTFRVRSDVAATLPQKRPALAEYRSQLSAAGEHAERWALDLVSQGEWLDCFTQDYELFRATKVTRR